jgi:DNA-binding protein HU-beta
MNKTELVNAIAEEANVKKTEAENVLNAIINCVGKTLGKGDKITLVGFGTFETKKRSAREGRNPKTGETIQIKESIVPSFKAGKTLKDKVNK